MKQINPREIYRRRNKNDDQEPVLRSTETSAHILPGDLEVILNLPQSKVPLAQQIPTYTANALILFQPVLSLRTFGLCMMFLTNKALNFLISWISKSFLCVCLLALLSFTLLGIFFFWFPSQVILSGMRNLYLSVHFSQERLFTISSSSKDISLHFFKLKVIFF